MNKLLTNYTFLVIIACFSGYLSNIFPLFLSLFEYF